MIDASRLAPGIYRVEAVVDDKLHGYYVLDGANGPIIVDPGVVDAPATVYRQFLRENGWTLGDVSLAVVTHADADLTYPLSGHYAARVERGTLVRTERDGVVAWRRR